MKFFIAPWSMACVAMTLIFGCGTSAEEELGDDAHWASITCPPTAPSYRLHIESVLKTRCMGCHEAGGAADYVPLDGYAHVFGRRHALLTVFQDSAMLPPDLAAEPTEKERLTVVQWLMCGAPNN